MQLTYEYLPCTAADLTIGDTVLERGKEHGRVARVHTEDQHRAKTLVIGFGTPAMTDNEGNITTDAVVTETVQWSPSRPVRRLTARFVGAA